MLGRIEDYLHSLPPQLWLIYHVNIKAVQCASVFGIVSFMLDSPLMIKKISGRYATKRNDGQKHLNLSKLNKHLYGSLVVCAIAGIGVTVYNLCHLEKDILEDRVYRIIGAEYQKQIDYSSIIGAAVGFLYAFKTLAFEDMDTNSKSALFKDVIGNGLIGVCCGVLFHTIRTQHFVSPQRIWMYTAQCWS